MRDYITATERLTFRAYIDTSTVKNMINDEIHRLEVIDSHQKDLLRAKQITENNLCILTNKL